MFPGADVNRYHPVQDWAAYLRSGRPFLAFKATGGANGWTWVDPTLDEHLTGVKAHGAHGLAYHFLTDDASGTAQADHFLAHVPHQGIILVCDFEFHEATSSFPTLKHLNDFVNRVKTVTARWPWVYTTRGVWYSLVKDGSNGPTQCPLWHAAWADKLSFTPYGGWTKPVMWQYTDSATIPGIPPPTDDNQCLVEPIDLIRYAWGTENVSAQDRGWGPPCPATSIVNIKPTATRSFNVHKRVAKIFDTFIRELEARGYDIEAGTLDDWSYNCRKITGSTSWSNHAWGLAVDINSLRNPMGSTLVTNMPAWVRDANYLMTKYGLRWGGTYSTRPDAMHFEFMLTPADADRISAALGTTTPQTVEEEVMSFYESRSEFEQRIRALAALGAQDTMRTAVGAGPDDPMADYWAKLARDAATDQDEATPEEVAVAVAAKLGGLSAQVATAVVAALEDKLPDGVTFTAGDVAKEIIRQLDEARPPA